MDDGDILRHALREERQFVITLGGFALEIPGSTLVTHERIPVPSFNFIQGVVVAPGRQAAFFERALDHYFQRSLRPSVRVADPVPHHLDEGMRRFGFRRRDERHLVMVHEGAVPALSDSPFTAREARTEEVDALVRFWTGEREGDEFRRSLEVTWAHPNPGESLRPLFVERGGTVVGAALFYESHGVAGIHAVSTQPSERGRGAATSLVEAALRLRVQSPPGIVTVATEERFADRRLGSIGFRPIGSFAVYELPADVALSLPDPGPAQPPRWRPPRQRPD
jgi:hypothetical protein